MSGICATQVDHDEQEARNYFGDLLKHLLFIVSRIGGGVTDFVAAVKSALREDGASGIP
jgi:hypothetical protein